MICRFLALLLLLSVPCIGNAAGAGYDKPLKLQHIALKPDAANPSAKPVLTCATYQNFMVKEVDRGEKGAALLSFTPLTGGAHPPCSEEQGATEKVIGGWSGYFRGVIGDNVFFDADDGWNGGMGFAIYSAGSGNKIFEDAAVKNIHIERAKTGTHLRYRRVYQAPCSLFADPKGCGDKIKEETGLRMPPSDCAASYKREQKRTPKSDVATAPSVLNYDVEVKLEDGKSPRILPTSDKSVCHISE